MPVLGMGHTEPATACPECGIPPPADARFCGACGARLRSATPPPGEALLPGRPEREPRTTRRRWRGPVAIVALIAIAGALIVLGGGGARAIAADEGRTPRGVGSTGVTSAEDVVPTDVAWRWTQAERAIGPAEPAFLNASERLDDLLLLDVDGVIHAVDPATGRNVWDSWGHGFDLQAIDGAIIVHAGTELLRLDAASGVVDHRNATTPVAAYGPSRPPVTDGIAVLDDVRGDVHGVDIETGASRWTVSNAWQERVTDSVVLLVRDDAHLLAVDIATGEELWSEPYGGWWYSATAGDVIVRHRAVGVVEAVDARTGANLWSPEQPDLGREPFAIGDDRLGVWSLSSTTTRSLRLFVVDAATGNELERIDLPDIGSASVTVTSDGVLVHDRSQLYLWRDGARVWTARTGPANEWSPAPLVDGDLVLLGVEDGVGAWDLATGAERWRLPIGSRSGFWWSDAVVTAGDDLLVVPPGPIDGGAALDRRTGIVMGSAAWGRPLLGTDRGVLTIDESGRLGMRSHTGNPMWSDSTPGYTFAAFSVDGDRAVTIGESTWDVGGPDEMTGKIEVIDLADGDQVASLTVPSSSGMAVRGTAIYVSHPLGQGVRRLDLRGDELIESWSSGTTVWGNRLMATDQHVVLAGPAEAVVFDAREGRELQRLAYDRLAPYLPVLWGTTLVVNVGGSELVAWNVRNGERKWTTRLEARPTAGMTVAGDTLLVPDDADHLNAVQLSDGTFVARVALGGQPVSSVLAAEGYLYVLLDAGDVVALR